MIAQRPSSELCLTLPLMDVIQSLNDNRESGPNLNPDVVTVLLNFRHTPAALVVDVEKAILQVVVKEGGGLQRAAVFLV